MSRSTVNFLSTSSVLAGRGWLDWMRLTATTCERCWSTLRCLRVAATEVLTTTFKSDQLNVEVSRTLGLNRQPSRGAGP